MPNLTLTIEDTSPLLIYSAEWMPGTARADPMLELYSGGSYMSTNTRGANVFFDFQGTNVALFGAKRQRNGFYQITVDSRAYTPVDGNATDPGNFQTSLFTSISLPNAQHTVSLASADGGVVDLDYVSWTTPVGNPEEEIIVNTFQENDPSFTYSPSDAWSNNPNNLGTFSGGSGRISSRAGATMKFKFQGDAVSLYGPVGPRGAAYSVSIDVGNGLPNNYSTNKLLYRPNMMLYHANSLGSGEHTVTIAVLPETDQSGESAGLAIDYAQVYTTPSLGGQRLGASSTSTGVSAGSVVGITAGGIFGAFVLIGIALWGVLWYNRKRHNRKFFYGFGEGSYKDSKDSSEGPDIERARPFRPYSELGVESPPPSRGQQTTMQSQTLQSQSSYSTITTPNSSQWPPTGGQGSSVEPLLPPAQPQVPPTPNTQEIVIPNRASTEKYRPDRTPQLQAPPQGQRSRPGQAPAALGATWQSISPVREESRSVVNTPPRPPPGTLRIETDISASAEVGNPLSPPPPEYSQQPIPSTAASSFYVREALR